MENFIDINHIENLLNAASAPSQKAIDSALSHAAQGRGITQQEIEV